MPPPSMRIENMKLLSILLAALASVRVVIDDLLTGLVTKGGAVGDIYFNVPRHEAHGILDVRHNAKIHRLQLARALAGRPGLEFDKR